MTQQQRDMLTEKRRAEFFAFAREQAAVSRDLLKKCKAALSKSRG